MSAVAQVHGEDDVEEGVLLDDARVNKVRRAIYAVTFVTCVIIFARLLLTLLVINPAELQPDIIAATDEREARVAAFILGQIGIFFLALAIPACGCIGAYTINRSFLLACIVYSGVLSIYGLVSLITQSASGGELLAGCNSTLPCFDDFLVVESLYVVFTFVCALLAVLLRQVLPVEAIVEPDILRAHVADEH